MAKGTSGLESRSATPDVTHRAYPQAPLWLSKVKFGKMMLCDLIVCPNPGQDRTRSLHLLSRISQVLLLVVANSWNTQYCREFLPRSVATDFPLKLSLLSQARLSIRNFSFSRFSSDIGEHPCLVLLVDWSYLRLACSFCEPFPPSFFPSLQKLLTTLQCNIIRSLQAHRAGISIVVFAI